MKKKFSKHWVSSKSPRKQRKYRKNAPLHIRRKMVAAILDKTLRKTYGKRSLPVKKGDEVLIMRGQFKGKTGTVSKVDLKKLKIYIEGIKMKKATGQEVEVPIDPSNVKIVKLNLDDRMRLKFIERKKNKE